MARQTDSQDMSAMVTELRQLAVAYLKQETIEPIKGLGRFVAYGAAGMTVLAGGLVLLLVAGLRAMQTEGGSTFTGHLSWVPYSVCAFAAMVALGAAGAAAAMGRGRHSPGSRSRGAGASEPPSPQPPASEPPASKPPASKPPASKPPASEPRTTP